MLVISKHSQLQEMNKLTQNYNILHYYYYYCYYYYYYYYNRFTALLDFVWDYPGEPVPER